MTTKVKPTVEKWDRPALFTSANDNWKTPQKFYEELNKDFGFDYDPCPPDPSFDGLTTEWGSVNFCNPPYSQIDKWIRKGFAEWQLGKTVVFLIPSRTDTRWWHDCCMKATEIRFVKGRLKFEGAKHNAPFPSVVVVFRVNEMKQPIQAQSVQEAKAEGAQRWINQPANQHDEEIRKAERERIVEIIESMPDIARGEFDPEAIDRQDLLSTLNTKEVK